MPSWLDHGPGRARRRRASSGSPNRPLRTRAFGPIRLTRSNAFGPPSPTRPVRRPPGIARRSSGPGCGKRTRPSEPLPSGPEPGGENGPAAARESPRGLGPRGLGWGGCPRYGDRCRAHSRYRRPRDCIRGLQGERRLCGRGRGPRWVYGDLCRRGTEEERERRLSERS